MYDGASPQLGVSAVASELWEFTTPPGEGIYRFTTIVDDRTGIRLSRNLPGAMPDGGVTDAEWAVCLRRTDGITPQSLLP